MFVNVEMWGNDQIAFAPREIKRAVPVREFGIQVKSISEFAGIGFRAFYPSQWRAGRKKKMPLIRLNVTTIP